MQIKSLTLKNFRGFKDTEITFSEGLTVLVGVNGAGKSSVLEALAMLMSWASTEIRGEGARWSLQEKEIHSGAESASIGACIEYGGSPFGWNAGIALGRREIGKTTPTGSYSEFATRVRQRISGTNPSVPIMVYYRANRAVTKVPVPPPPDARCFDLLETYASSLPAETEDFHLFFEWFRAREDLENERRLRAEGQIGLRDRDMEAVRSALEAVLPGLSKPVVRRLPEALVMEKNGLEIRVDRLSDGEKLLIALAGDLARRIALANPSMDNPLHGEGVVLIDEIEQHLHPAWQRTILGNLRRTFPNVQFIVSTHSPQVLGEVSHEDIRILDCDPELGQQAYLPSRSLGLDSSAILEEIFHTGRRRDDVSRKLTSIFDLIDADSFDQAMTEIEALENELGANIPELIEARTMIAMLGGVGAEHR